MSPDSLLKPCLLEAASYFMNRFSNKKEQENIHIYVYDVGKICTYFTHKHLCSFGWGIRGAHV